MSLVNIAASLKTTPILPNRYLNTVQLFQHIHMKIKSNQITLTQSKGNNLKIIGFYGTGGVIDSSIVCSKLVHSIVLKHFVDSKNIFLYL